MQQNNQDLRSTWMSYRTQDCFNYTDTYNEGDIAIEVAEYFFDAGVASTKRKPQQVPVLFKPKD